MSIGAVLHIWHELTAHSPLDLALWDAEGNELHVFGLTVRGSMRERPRRHVHSLFFFFHLNVDDFAVPSTFLQNVH